MPANQPMACPLDGSTLVMSERAGIEIDYCPSCRGVWLDRGELDKIIARSGADEQPVPQGRPLQHESHRYQGKPYKRRKSFLEELFD